MTPKPIYHVQQHVEFSIIDNRNINQQFMLHVVKLHGSRVDRFTGNFNSNISL